MSEEHFEAHHQQQSTLVAQRVRNAILFLFAYAPARVS